MVGEDANVKVYVRCRDVSRGPEVDKCYNTVSSKEIVRSGDTSKKYQFDHVFSAGSDQKSVFGECALPLIDEFIKGYNGTLFAYGQTGTGKTYTMTGECVPPSDSERAGIVPRVLEAIFRRLEAEQDWILELKYIELYNEELRDLLNQPVKPKDKPPTNSSTNHSMKQLKIIEGRNKSIEVMGATSVPVSNLDSALAIVRDATARRQTASTRLNVDSSRSHTVLTLILVSREPVSGMAVRSKLHLVDLAGSENVAKSGAVKLRAQEAGEINKSLLSLGRVIEMLVRSGSSAPKPSTSMVRENGRHSGKHGEPAARGKPYVSYRDSKLTHILQDSLGGSTKTRMIATISLAPCDVDETKSTLEYASRARSIRNQIQTEVEVMDMHITLKELAKQLEDTQQELRIQRSRDGGAYLSNYNYQQLKSGQRKYAELLAQKETESKHQDLKLSDARSENAALIAERDVLKDQVRDLMDKRRDYELSADAGAKIKESTDVAISALTRYTGDLDRYTEALYDKLEALPHNLEALKDKFRNYLGNSQILSASESVQDEAKRGLEEQAAVFKQDLVQWFDQLADSMATTLQSALVAANKSIMGLAESIESAGTACSKLERHFDNMQADIAVQQNTSSETLKLVSKLEAADNECYAVVEQHFAKRRELLAKLAATEQQTAMPRLSNSASEAVAVATDIRNVLSKCTITDEVKRLEELNVASQANNFRANLSQRLMSTIDQNLPSMVSDMAHSIDLVSDSCKERVTQGGEEHAKALDELLQSVSQTLQDTGGYKRSSLLCTHGMKTKVSELMHKVADMAQAPEGSPEFGNLRWPTNSRASPRNSPRREHESRNTKVRKGSANPPASPTRTASATRSPLRPTSFNRLVPKLPADPTPLKFSDKLLSTQLPVRAVSRVQAGSNVFPDTRRQARQKPGSRLDLPPAKRRRNDP